MTVIGSGTAVVSSGRIDVFGWLSEGLSESRRSPNKCIVGLTRKISYLVWDREIRILGNYQR